LMFIGPATIALREGIEAALIIAIMLSYLKRANKTDLKNYVLGGVLFALLASIAFGAIMGLVWGLFEGEALTIFEGVVVLVAAALLTTMIVWMWNAGSGIASEIEDSLQERTGAQGGVGLALLAFTLILREGVELVLFTIALAVQDATQTYLGVTVGLGIALVMGIGIYQGSLRISIQKFFNWTSVFLVLFAAGMIAYGVHELQEAGLLLIGPIEIWNINPPLLPDGSYPLLHDKGAIGGFLKALFGYNGNPSALEVIAYIGYLLIVSLYYLSRRNKIQKEIESAAPAEEIVSTA
ncbi:MAG: FTR1 family protein, partial [Candidatus Thorarchaeota archaeon]|nr:FTR1 family protein [Candidatus Thorarchaeota archaeon]